MLETDFVPTKGSSVKPKAAENFQAVIYESRKSKQKAEEHRAPKEKVERNKNVDEFNIKKVKHEVVKLAMTGLGAEEKQEARVRLAISLGAKPKKNKYKNYKLLKEEKLKEKLEKDKKAKFQQLGKDKLGKSTAKGKSYDRKRRKGKGGLLDVYGKVIKPEATKVRIAKKK